MSMPAPPPDTRAPGQAGHIADHNTISDALTALENNVGALQSQANPGLTPTAVQTSAYTANPQDYVVCDATAGSFTVTLPANAVSGTRVGVKMIGTSGTNTVTVQCPSGDVLNKTGGSTSVQLKLLNQASIFQRQATLGIWYIISDDLALSQLPGLTFPINPINAPYNADLTGANDATAAIQAALDAAAAAGGGEVWPPPGTYKAGNLHIDSKVTLRSGVGVNYIAAPGASGYMISLKNPGSTYQAKIIGGNWKPNTGSLGGVLLDNTGYSAPSGAPTSPLHELEDIYVFNSGGDAFHFGVNVRALRVTRCRQDNSGGYGFYIDAGCTDSRFVGCTSGTSTLDGWYVKGWVNNFSACRSSLAGWTGGTPGTTGVGWNIFGGYNTFTSCSSQQAALHGWQLSQLSGNACNYNTIIGCEADTNNQGQTTGVGFNINGATYCAVIGCVGANNGGVGPGQVWGIQLSGTLTGCYVSGNPVAGTSGGTTGSVSSAIVPVSGQLLCSPASYAPAAQTLLTTTSATFVAVSSGNATTNSFIAPPSGNVIVTAKLVAGVSAAVNLAFTLAAHGSVTPLCNAEILREAGAATPREYVIPFLVTGLTPGNSYSLDLLFAVAGASTLTVYAYGTTSTAPTGTNGGPVIMTVQAV
jgi:hypothetical protein